MIGLKVVAGEGQRAAHGPDGGNLLGLRGQLLLAAGGGLETEDDQTAGRRRLERPAEVAPVDRLAHGQPQALVGHGRLDAVQHAGINGSAPQHPVETLRSQDHDHDLAAGAKAGRGLLVPARAAPVMPGGKPVTEPGHGRMDLGGGVRMDVRGVVQHAGNGADANPGYAGDVDDGVGFFQGRTAG